MEKRGLSLSMVFLSVLSIRVGRNLQVALMRGGDASDEWLQKQGIGDK